MTAFHQWRQTCVARASSHHIVRESAVSVERRFPEPPRMTGAGRLESGDSEILGMNKAIVNLAALWLSRVIDSECVAMHQLRPDAIHSGSSDHLLI